MPHRIDDLLVLNANLNKTDFGNNRIGLDIWCATATPWNTFI